MDKPVDLPTFWQMIDEARSSSGIDIGLLVQSLKAIDSVKIKIFNWTLGHLLFEIDREDLYSIYEGTGETELVDPDGFLYWRAGLIAAGRETYESFRASDSNLEASDIPECEALLWAASDAAGSDLDFGVTIETGSNRNAWLTTARKESAHKVGALGSEEADVLRGHWITLEVEDVTLPALPDSEQFSPLFIRYPSPEDLNFIAQEVRHRIARSLTEGVGRAGAPDRGVSILIQLSDQSASPFFGMVHNSHDPTVYEEGVIAAISAAEVATLSRQGAEELFTRTMLDALLLVDFKNAALSRNLTSLRRANSLE